MSVEAVIADTWGRKTSSGYLHDPANWVVDRGSGFAWSKQVEILESVRDNRYTAVKSCHGAGKSYSAAQVIGWWIDAHPPGTAAAVTSAPTGDQVKKILWKEINRVHRSGPNRSGKLPGRTNQTEWWIGSDPVAFGRKPSDYDQAAFQGIHEEFVLVVFDEADGIPQVLYDEAAGLLTNDDCRMLLIGNPYDPQSPFARACTPGSLYNTITISAFDTPNFTGEQVPDRVRRLLVSPGWVEERKKEWGEDSALYTAKVLAEFPTDTDDGVIPLSAVQRLRTVDWVNDGAHLEPVELGVDIAAGGADQTVIRERRGRTIGRRWAVSSKDPQVVSGEIIRAVNESGARAVKIDVIGWGWGVAGMLRLERDRGRHGAEVIGVNVAEASSDQTRFHNLRDELWWTVGREAIQQGRYDLTGLDDRTVSDLTAPRYATPGGKIKIERKQDTVERLGRSPDDGDAFLLAFFEPVRAVQTGRRDYVIDDYQEAA